MNELRNKVLDIVEELNSDVAEKGGLEYYAPYEFKSIGWQGSAVYFMGIFIWSDENDERDYIADSDEKEPMNQFLIKQGFKILKDLNLKMSAF